MMKEGLRDCSMAERKKETRVKRVKYNGSDEAVIIKNQDVGNKEVKKSAYLKGRG